MKWFWRWVDRKIQRSQEYTCDAAPKNRLAGTDGISAANSINFRLYSAAGGTVIEIRHESRFRDWSENDLSLYVIKDDEDIGAGIKKILTLEKLRR